MQGALSPASGRPRPVRWRSGARRGGSRDRYPIAERTALRGGLAAGPRMPRWHHAAGRPGAFDFGHAARSGSRPRAWYGLAIVGRLGSVANRSATHQTRLETRTKESSMCASHGVSRNPRAQ
ncbi:hypothetical protein DPMN_087837 [Dreissena polymorpha]|uniref:Uncharacterized protein n=1 Tax=Dreissena polymorpha TaxID=45954 RepID=A0A9D4KTE7_DREPO|nr:hypothetical protein DPMN_087837 [Dreissena polymorpha]